MNQTDSGWRKRQIAEIKGTIMTKDDIINRMQEAGLKAPTQGDYIFIHWDQLALLLAHEIEACAKVCEEHIEWPSLGPKDCADAIRARGQA